MESHQGIALINFDCITIEKSNQVKISRQIMWCQGTGHILVLVHNIISNFCCTNGLYYIHTRNTRADCLYKKRLDLLDKEKILLTNNFIINLNRNFLTTHTPPPRFSLNQECISKRTSNSMEADL